MSDDLRILFVDDDELTRMIFQDAIKSLGIPVDVAPGFAEAESLASIHAYAVIVTDLYMPEVDGFELATRLRSRQPGARFVLVSGRLDDDTEHKALHVHKFDRVIHKPWDAGKLSAELRELL